MKAVATDRII